MLEPLSDRQIETVLSVGHVGLDIHCGPMGCGKTLSIALGLGLACMNTPPPRDGGCIAIVGKTAKTVKANVCNYLASHFGDNFRYDTGKKDGFDKDATLFGHLIRIIGLNDAGAEARIRGMSAYLIIGDELSTWSEENYDKIFGRLRGNPPKGWILGFVGSTNPDYPTHWLKVKLDGGNGIRSIEWTKEDNITSGAYAYYAVLIERWANNPSNLARYVFGKWAAAEGLVYPEFREKEHVLTKQQVAELMPHFRSFKLGVDFGTTNPTAILLIGITEEEEEVVCEEVYVRGASLTFIVAQIRRLYVEYYKKFTYVYVDPSANVLITQLKSEGLIDIVGANNDVYNGIDKVKDMFTHNKLFICETCTNLIGEMYAYAYSTRNRAKVLKENDHCSDGLRYAVYN